MLIDLYVLAAKRDARLAKRFMDTWGRGFEPVAAEYEFPQYAERPASVFESPMQLVDALIKAPEEPHSIYWSNPGEGRVRNAMVFFTRDGEMIAGLSVFNEERSDLGWYLQELARTVDGRFGYCAYEEPPPETKPEFIVSVKRASGPRIEDGILVPSIS